MVGKVLGNFYLSNGEKMKPHTSTEAPKAF